MSNPQCACGVFAIGLCSRCKAPRCGDHGVQRGGRFICAKHIAEDEVDRQRTLERQRSDVALQLQEWLQGISHPAERLVAAATHLVHENGRYKYVSGPVQVTWQGLPAIKESFPEFAPEGLAAFIDATRKDKDSGYAPGANQLTSWFAARAHALRVRQADTYVPIRVKQTTFGKQKTVEDPPVPAWCLARTYVLSDASRQPYSTLTLDDLKRMGQLVPVPTLPAELRNAVHSRWPVHFGGPIVYIGAFDWT